MADDVITTNGSSDGATAVAEPPERDMRALAAESPAPLVAVKKKRGKDKKKQQNGDLDYEVEFETPFGKVEFEFEPLTSKLRKDAERKERAARAAARAAAKAALLAEKRAVSAARGEASAIGRGGVVLIALVIVGVVTAAVVVAVWLFARPGEEEAIPAEFLTDDGLMPEPAPQGFLARVRSRGSKAIHAGKQASREAQAEQQQKFEQLSGR